MDILYSILTLITGIAALIYTYKNSNIKEADPWDKLMIFKGYAGGILFIVIAFVTLVNGW